MSCDIFYDLPNGAKMPALGYGTWLSSNEAELEKSLEVALEVGYRHIDTAFVYQNEHVVGRVINKWIKSGKGTRDDIFLVTKLPPTAMRAACVPKYLQLSLKNLQLDYVDLYLIHMPFGLNECESGNLIPTREDGTADIDSTTDHLAIWRAMEEQVDAGLAKNIGLSNFNVQQIQKVLDVARIPPCCLQIEIHAYFQQIELINYCTRNNIVVTAYSPLGNPGMVKKMEFRGADLFGDPVVRQIAKKHHKTPAQILLRHLIQKKLIVIPKSVTIQRVRENFQIFDFKLSDSDMKMLNGLDAGVRIFDFSDIFTGVKKHPEFPFKDCL